MKSGSTLCYDFDVQATVEESVTKSPCANSSDEKNLAVADGSAMIASRSIPVKERLTLRQTQGPQGPVGHPQQQTGTAALVSFPSRQ